MKVATKITTVLLSAYFAVSSAGCSLQTIPPESPSPAIPIPAEHTAAPGVLLPGSASRELDTPWEDRSIFRAGLIPSEQGALDELEGASVYHINFQISNDFLNLAGWEEVHYTNREAKALDVIYFQLFPNAVAGGRSAVSGVTVDGQEAESTYEFQDTALRVTLPAPLKPGNSSDIRLEFVVNLPQEMGGNYGLFGYFDKVLVLDEFYPVIPVYDDAGWNVQDPPPNADSSYFDISFYLVRVTAPANLTMAASGVAVSRESGTGQQTITFAAGPVRDFYLAASADFTMVSEVSGETVINSYTLKDHDQGARAALRFARDALDRFGEHFGPYPYTEFDLLSAPMLALGIEYPGIVGVTLPAFDPQGEVAGLPFPIMLESVVAHESAHQWFYNVVGNDQIDEPWLDEAMAQYATWLYYHDVYGETNAQGYRASWDERWQRVDGANIPIGLPAYVYQGKEYGAIVYGRGPIFVETLGEAMGQESFPTFLRQYYQTHQWGIATTDSFRQLAEETCGCDLSALFEAWVLP